ncbi:hypothetical protein [Pseudomonas sp. D(2018)]|uniref:hypothetical protein n=1 Tax=Pseudomonas sp. D(2018) TaxID=2502238 RepID=UPI0010F591FE|nr:hypothetical protein [Pseudomonas sp. D(2018)]
MLEIEAESLFKKYSLTETSLYAISTQSNSSSDFPWDEILYSVADSIAASLGGGIGAIIVEAVRSSEKDWRESVSKQLEMVNQKLDQILNEIRALQEFIAENERASTRQMLHAQITTHINGVTDILENIKKHKKFSDDLREQLHKSVFSLATSVDTLIEYKGIRSETPFALPLYASIQSGLIILALGYRILELSLFEEKTPRVIEKFEQWRAYLEDHIKPKIAEAYTETEHLNNYPKFGYLAVANTDNNLSYHPAYKDKTYLVFAKITGSSNEQFRLLELGKGPVIGNYDTSLEGIQEVIEQHIVPNHFPSPYYFMVLSPKNESRHTLAILMGKMISELNDRRDKLVLKLSYIEEVQNLIKSLDSGEKLINRLGDHHQISQISDVTT